MDDKQRITSWLENEHDWLIKQKNIIQATGKNCTVEKTGNKEALFYVDGFYKYNIWVPIHPNKDKNINI